MGQNKHQRLPLNWIFLDVLGTILLGLGLFGLFAGDEIDMFGFLELRDYAWQYIIGGVILMLPLYTHFIKKILAGRSSKQ